MRSRSLLRDARDCRRMAVAHKGKEEFQFLLSLADAFERLAAAQMQQDRTIRELKTRPKSLPNSTFTVQLTCKLLPDKRPRREDGSP